MNSVLYWAFLAGSLFAFLSWRRRSTPPITPNKCPEGSPLGQLQDSLAFSFLKHEFIPRSTIDAAINETTVRDILVEEGLVDADCVQAEDLAKKIVQHARKMFAILVVLNKARDIRTFLKLGIQDHDLPFSLRVENEQLPPILRTNQGREIMAPEDWNYGTLRDLEKKQWDMLAPVFRKNGHYEFPKTQLLPFAGQTIVAIRQGAHGEVFRGRIHFDHHDFWEPSTIKGKEYAPVAIKKLFWTDPQLFEQEREFLKALGSAGPHPHLINLLCTYTHKGYNYLMFPCADENLRDFWKRTPLPDFNDRLLLWCLKQIVGIASGLSRIHELPRPSGPSNTTLYGRHGDIKAENILYFKMRPECPNPDGILLIADLGLAKFHSFGSRSTDPAATVAFATTYSPPLHHNDRVNREFDVWSLGCLYLEFITWIVCGEEAIGQFSELRGKDDSNTEINSDFFYSKDLKTVRPSVRKWVAELKEDPRCTHVLCDLLDLVIENMIRIHARTRSSAQRVHFRLNEMYEKARKDKKYLLEKKQKSPKQQEPPLLSRSGSGRQPGLVADHPDSCHQDDFAHLRSRVTWPQIASRS